jgi:1-acyl-sn-glycerol-3-phosphate acyltransferase
MKNNKIPWYKKLFDPKMAFQDFVRFTGFPVLLYYRIKYVYENKEAKKFRKGTSVMICNHRQFSDITKLYCIMAYRRLVILTATEVYNSNFNWFFKRVNCVQIDRDKPSPKTFKQCVNALNHGHHLAIFPEGKLLEEGEDVEYKPGAIFIALLGNVPIVPLYIKPRKSKWHRLVVAVGEPIDVNKLVTDKRNEEEVKRATKYLKDKVNELKSLTEK